jgi:hypothetical protein
MPLPKCGRRGGGPGYESGKGEERFSRRRSRTRDYLPASDATASISISIFGSGTAYHRTTLRIPRNPSCANKRIRREWKILKPRVYLNLGGQMRVSKIIIILVAAHALLVLPALFGASWLISSPRQAPMIIFWYSVIFVCYFVGRIWIGWSSGDGLAKPLRRHFSYLALPLIVCSIVIVQAAFQFFRGAETLSSSLFDFPVLGRSREGDEISAIAFSLFITTFVAFGWTSESSSVARPGEAPSHPYGDIKSAGSGRELVILQFVERATYLQKRSTYILFGIILMLICAAIFIVFAGQVTSLDVSGVKAVSLAQSDVRAAEDELERINSESARKIAQRKRAKDAASKDASRSDSEDVFVSDSDDEITKIKFDAKKEALKKANDVLLRVKDKQFEDDRSKDQASGQLLLIQTSVTRFGVVLILVFLVQILVSLYRYNMRLAAFYFARADGLVLLSRMPSNLGTLVNIVSPDKIDFGKPPKTPAEEATGLLHAWTGGHRRLASKTQAEPRAR